MPSTGSPKPALAKTTLRTRSVKDAGGLASEVRPAVVGNSCSRGSQRDGVYKPLSTPPCAKRTRGYPPRVRGNTLESHSAVSILGPSPRTRGKHSLTPVLMPRRGAIPAYAGETRHTRSRHWSARGHPRVRGGNPLGNVQTWSTLGPSPRTRWKQFGIAAVLAVDGAIPAYAGETSTSASFHLEHRGHPRVRGGNTEMALQLFLHQGPSPRTRGKLKPRPTATSRS